MNCVSCGSEIPDGQGRSCSMCYGDIDYGSDGYYRRWAEEQLAKECQAEMEARRLEDLREEEAERFKSIEEIL